MPRSPPMDAIDHAVDILRMFDIEPQPLDRLLDRYLRRHREIGSRNRRLVADAVFGVVRWQRRIDGWLRLAGVRKARERERVLAYLAWKRPEGFDPVAEVLAPSQAASRIDLDAPEPSRFPGGRAGFHSFPDFLYERLVRSVGEEGAEALAERLNAPSRPTLRVNALRASREEALAMLSGAGVAATPTERSPYGIRLAGRADLGSLEAYRRGIVEVQDEASQLAVLAADPRPGERVLDACAGAGGKALLLAMLLENRGSLVATDPDRKKLDKLERRAGRAGAHCIAVVPPTRRGREQVDADRFDLVFIDAPCSGTGTLRRSPDLRWRLTPEILRERVALQRDLLERLSERVHPGGRLFYATCSVLEEENEAVVEAFLRRGDFEIGDVGAALTRTGVAPEGLVTGDGYFKADPREGDWDGFFGALLRRKP